MVGRVADCSTALASLSKYQFVCGQNANANLMPLIAMSGVGVGASPQSCQQAVTHAVNGIACYYNYNSDSRAYEFRWLSQQYTSTSSYSSFDECMFYGKQGKG